MFELSRVVTEEDEVNVSIFETIVSKLRRESETAKSFMEKVLFCSSILNLPSLPTKPGRLSILHEKLTQTHLFIYSDLTATQAELNGQSTPG